MSGIVGPNDSGISEGVLTGKSNGSAGSIDSQTALISIGGVSGVDVVTPSSKFRSAVLSSSSAAAAGTGTGTGSTGTTASSVLSPITESVEELGTPHMPWSTMFVVGASIMPVGLLASVLGPSLLAIGKAYGLDAADAGVIVTLLFCGTTCGDLLWLCVMNNRVHYRFLLRLLPDEVTAGKRMMCLGFGLLIASNLLIFLTPTSSGFGLLLFWTFLAGMGGGMNSLSGDSIISTWDDRIMGTALSLLHAASGVGTITAPWLQQQLSRTRDLPLESEPDTESWRRYFLMISIWSFLLWCMIMLTNMKVKARPRPIGVRGRWGTRAVAPPPAPAQPAQNSVELSIMPSSSAAAAIAPSPPPVSIANGLLKTNSRILLLITDFRYWFICLSLFFSNGSVVLIGAWQYTLVYEKGYTGGRTATLSTSLFWGGILFGRLVSAHIASRYTRNATNTMNFLFVSCVMSAVAPLGVVFATRRISLDAFAAVVGMSLSPLLPFLAALTINCDLFADPITGSTAVPIGGVIISGQLGALALPAIMGFLSQKSGQLDMCLLLVSAASIISLSCLISFRKQYLLATAQHPLSPAATVAEVPMSLSPTGTISAAGPTVVAAVVAAAPAPVESIPVLPPIAESEFSEQTDLTRTTVPGAVH